jgi:hypothetical protein
MIHEFKLLGASAHIDAASLARTHTMLVVINGRPVEAVINDKDFEYIHRECTATHNKEASAPRPAAQHARDDGDTLINWAKDIPQDLRDVLAMEGLPNPCRRSVLEATLQRLAAETTDVEMDEDGVGQL